MNILQVGTVDIIGGAAKVLYRLHQEFKKMGHTSKMAVGTKYSQDKDVVQFGGGKYINYIQRKLEYYTGLQSYSSFQSKTCFQEADIIQLHNIHGGFFNLRELAQISQKKPVVWTLHDEWTLTGHCAYTLEDDCPKWRSGCGDCPRLGTYPAIRKDTSRQIWQNKKAIYLKSKIVIITPCNWLKKRAGQGILSHFEILCIPNGIDHQLFSPTNKNKVRAKLGLPLNKKIIVFNSAYPESEFKGFSFLVDTLKRLPPRDDLALLVLGAKESFNIPEFGFEVFNPGYIKDETTLAEYYSAADIFILPSVAETAPLVVLEAMACGLPVVAFNAGGTPEVVCHMETGYIAKYKDSADLTKGILIFLDNETLSEKARMLCRKTIEDDYQLDTQTQRYLKLYESVIEKFRPC